MTYVLVNGSGGFVEDRGSISVEDDIITISGGVYKSGMEVRGEVLYGGTVVSVPKTDISHAHTAFMSEYTGKVISIFANNSGWWWWDVWGKYAFPTPSQFNIGDASFSVGDRIIIDDGATTYSATIIGVSGGVASLDISVSVGLHKIISVPPTSYGDFAYVGRVCPQENLDPKVLFDGVALDGEFPLFGYDPFTVLDNNVTIGATNQWVKIGVISINTVHTWYTFRFTVDMLLFSGDVVVRVKTIGDLNSVYIDVGTTTAGIAKVMLTWNTGGEINVYLFCSSWNGKLDIKASFVGSKNTLPVSAGVFGVSSVYDTDSGGTTLPTDGKTLNIVRGV